MKKGILIAGIQVSQFPESKNPDVKNAKLNVLYPMENLDLPKIKRNCTGLTTETPFGKQDLAIDVEYAEKLVNTRAFVPLKEYEVVVSFDPDSMENVITELKPVDPEVQAHFNTTLGKKA